VPLRIVVTRQPELRIRLGFKEMPTGTYQDLVLHEVPRRTIKYDIRLILEYELGTIRERARISFRLAGNATDSSAGQAGCAAAHLYDYCASIYCTKVSYPTAYSNKVLQHRKATISQLERIYLPVLGSASR
jgi:hypothetical protein